MGPQDSNPAGGTSLRNFGNSVFPWSFVGDIISRSVPLSGVYARGSKRSHTKGRA